jgi:predicted alpha/beta hydrolase family esterase
MSTSQDATVLIVPGLREHVADHWQTLLQAELPGAQSVPPLDTDKLSRRARVAALDAAFARIDGPVILVAHSAGCLTTVHWAGALGAAAARVRGALLVTPPDLDAAWPDKYPSPAVLAENGWRPLPRARLPFRTIVAASADDPLASPDAVRGMARDWGCALVELGAVGHMNPASDFGRWPLAHALIGQLQAR